VGRRTSNSDASRSCRRGERQFQLRLTTGRSLWQFHFLPFNRNVALPEKQTSQLLASECVRQKVVPHSDRYLESVQLAFHSKRFNRA
jgi:hypothetical protein